MGKVVKLEEAIRISEELKKQSKTIVLVGGCFDILHQGHLIFLEKAKTQGDYLFVALESDTNVKRLKDNGRPINKQGLRAENLAKLDKVDYVISLPTFTTDRAYFAFTKHLSPDIIAITEGDPKEKEKQRQATAVGGRVVVVTKYIKKYSTTKVLADL